MDGTAVPPIIYPLVPVIVSSGVVELGFAIGRVGLMIVGMVVRSVHVVLTTETALRAG